MLEVFRRNKPTNPIDAQITAVTDKMAEIGVEDPNYKPLLEHLAKLNEMKTRDRRKPVSMDTVAIGIFGMAQMLVIVVYENKHIMASKGWTGILRPKSDHHTQ